MSELLSIDECVTNGGHCKVVTEVDVTGGVLLKDVSPGLLSALQELGDDYGPLGVARVASLMAQKPTND